MRRKRTLGRRRKYQRVAFHVLRDGREDSASMNQEQDAILRRTFREQKRAGRLKAGEQKQKPQQTVLVEVRECPRMQSKKKKERIKDFLSTMDGN